MIKQNTIVKIVDNSGAKTAKCIKILGGYKKKYAVIGDFIIVSIKNLQLKSNRLQIKKKMLFKGIVLQTKKFTVSNTGFKFQFKNNCIILVDKNNNPIANRFFTLISYKYRNNLQKLKFFSLQIF